MDYFEYIGYKADKYKKAISQLHDTTHACYGSYANTLITADRKLRDKLIALYFFLGIATDVKLLDPKTGIIS